MEKKQNTVFSLLHSQQDITIRDIYQIHCKICKLIINLQHMLVPVFRFVSIPFVEMPWILQEALPKLQPR